VEAVAERYEIKSKLLRELSLLVRPGTILASNTSSISLTKLAANAERPEEVIGMHFMNPVPVMKLVEVIRGLQTSQATLDKTLEVAELLGKATCQSADRPGFIANRVLVPYLNEAINVLNEGIATKEDIDKCMVLGTNVPMGPLALSDFIGLDTVLYILNVLHEEFGDSKYRPSPLLVNYVHAGWLGKKTGRGFYEYPKK
jgi:3-hydroxybutyryl-CoA dehydrogenase